MRAPIAIHIGSKFEPNSTPKIPYCCVAFIYRQSQQNHEMIINQVTWFANLNAKLNFIFKKVG
jgi:hypothetical protein